MGQASKQVGEKVDQEKLRNVFFCPNLNRRKSLNVAENFGKTGAKRQFVCKRNQSVTFQIFSFQRHSPVMPTHFRHRFKSKSDLCIKLHQYKSAQLNITVSWALILEIWLEEMIFYLSIWTIRLVLKAWGSNRQAITVEVLL